MTVQYLKKSPKTSSTDDVKTRELVQKILNDFQRKDINVYSILKKITKNFFN